MNRGDMPANALTGDAYTDLQGYKGLGGAYEDGMGMTIREKMAMTIAAGLVTATDKDGQWFHDAETVADTATEYADALLAKLAESNQ